MTSDFDDLWTNANSALHVQFGVAASYVPPIAGATTVAGLTVILDQENSMDIETGPEKRMQQVATLRVRTSQLTPARHGRILIGNDWWTITNVPHDDAGEWICEVRREFRQHIGEARRA